MKIKQIIIVCLCLVMSLGVFGQDKVLVFTKTNGFTHGSIDDGIAMIEDLGVANELWDTDNTANASAFTIENLEKYKVIIWCNTSGNGLLNASQREAFEDYIANGGGFVGIHAATDTYRDKSWPFYNDLVGAIVQSNPYHTSRTHNATMTVNAQDHSTVDFLGATWNKTEEYYYWKNNGGQLYSGNVDLLTVEATGSNDYDESRPISWYKEYAGGRSFYTALGHNDSDYTDDSDFIKHVEEGIKWAGNFVSTPEAQLLENDTYSIKRPGTVQVLASSLATAHNASMEDNEENATQIWEFNHLGNNEYTIRNTETQRYLEVPQAKCESSANVGTWTSANASHQKFKIIKVDGDYFLKPMHCLQYAIDRDKGVDDANVHLWEASTTNTNQKWDIVQAGMTLSTSATYSTGTKQLAIHPNPAQNRISITGLFETTELHILGINGRAIMKLDYDPVANNIINISSLSAGIYFIKANQGAFKTIKLVKIKN